MSETADYIVAFIEAVYPGNAELALASFNEKTALTDATARIHALQAVVDAMDGWWTCDGCGGKFSPETKNVGHDCDLCTACAESCREAEEAEEEAKP